MKEAIIIDGSHGEGGGQILRSSLSLSMITGKPFKIKNIRAGRAKPGLMRQHLTCVKAAAEICNAEVAGADIGSQEFFFIPKAIKAGDYNFSIGTAGSTMLVAQTIIPALMMADSHSNIILKGGTHNDHAPTYDFVEQSFFPILKNMGVGIESEIRKYGFYPVGGGEISVSITPAKKLYPFEISKRGECKGHKGKIILANVPFDVAEREIKVISQRLNWSEDNFDIRQVKNSPSSGNVVSIALKYENITEHILELGSLGVSAEKVAHRISDKVKKYLNGSAPVGEYLADQILLPLALCGNGYFVTVKPSLHTLTNIDVIHKFLPCRIVSEETKSGNWMISIEGA